MGTSRHIQFCLRCFAIDPDNPYRWSEKEIAELHNLTTVILAADGKKIPLDTLQNAPGSGARLTGHVCGLKQACWGHQGLFLDRKGRSSFLQGW